MNFTYNNHLKYFIGDRLYGFRNTPYEKFRVTVGSIDKDRYKNSNWLDEQYRTAQIISKEYGKDFVVLFSGGTDSEIVLRSFLKIGIAPRVVFIKFKDDFNLGDYTEANRVCSELNLNLETIEFDVFDFYRSGAAIEFSETIQCRQMAYLIVYYQILKLQLPAVMGGEMLFQKEITAKHSKWYFCFRENQDGSAMRFSHKFNIPLVNEWFSYTPEMMGYFLSNEKLQKLFNNPKNYKLSSVSSKNEILTELVPNLSKKTKTHGYEKLMGLNQEAYNNLYKGDMIRLENSLDGLYINDLKQQLFN